MAIIKQRATENTLGLPRALGDGLVLRWARPEDAEALAEFQGRIFSEDDQPEEAIGYWTRDVMRGEHPNTGPTDFTIVEDTNKGGKIVSTLNLISQTWAYDGIPFGLGRPEAIGTAAQYRRKGLVRQQLDVIHARSAERGELMQAIIGIPWYYRQFGYEMALDLNGTRRFLWQNVSKLDVDETGNLRVRPATAEDIPLLAQLYTIHCSSSLISRVRNETEWLHELTVNEKSIEHANFFIIEDFGGNGVGYFKASYAPDGIAVRELAVLPGNSLRFVGEFLTRALQNLSEEQAKAEIKPLVSSASFTLGTFHPIYTALGDQLEKLIKPTAFYIRIPDVAAFIRKISPALEKRLVGSVMENHSGTLRLNFYHQHMTLVFERGKLLEVGTYQPKTMEDGDASFPDLTFLQLLLGYRSLADLQQAYQDVYPANERAAVLLNTLFPPRPSLLSVMG